MQGGIRALTGRRVRLRQEQTIVLPADTEGEVGMVGPLPQPEGVDDEEVDWNKLASYDQWGPILKFTVDTPDGFVVVFWHVDLAGYKALVVEIRR